MLNTERNTKNMEKRVLRAARRYFSRRKGICSFYEHGQWFVSVDDYYSDEDQPTMFSVVDADGGDSVDGFSFEEL